MEFVLNSQETVGVGLSENESEAVKTAFFNLKTDLSRAVGIHCADAGADSRILVGTVGVSELTAPYVDADRLKDEQGRLRREAYMMKVCGNRLVIAGTDRRGTIYGIYDLCERIGVSPWHYFADVPVKVKEQIALEDGFEVIDYPSVEYRGIFINDEEELDCWARLHMDEDTIGVHTYEKIFELILRLKGNYIWPAMHVNSFNLKVENGALADRMGLVVGTSHCDMLMRSNNREWIPWITKKGYDDAVYDYSVEGRNRDILKEYWRESVEQNRDFEVSYTLGMRGIHDSGFETRALKAESKEEMRRKKVELLQKVIGDQKEILADTLGRDTLKLFVPYKEVLDLYDNGLDVPEDITLIWSNDNYGYVRRYPSEKEQRRSGGNGIYYHNSYWSPPGRSYLFICSIPLAQTKYELEKAYENGIQKLWVMNVGALKPLEQEMEYYLRLAWEIGKENGSTSDVDAWLAGWIDRNFSGGHGDEMAGILNDFTQLTNVRKIENLDNDTFSQTAYGDEGAVRLNRYKEMYDRANAIYESLPENEKPAFFQMALMKIHAAYYTNAQYYFADRSTLCVNQGKMQAAALYTEYSRFYDDQRRRMLKYYNEEMLGGKWWGMVTPEDFPPPRTAMHPACTPPLSIGGREMLITLWNGDSELRFTKPATKWFEIANAGAGEFTFEAEADDWMKLSEIRGTVRGEIRILVTVEDTAASRKGRIQVRNRTDQTVTCIDVTVQSLTELLSAADSAANCSSRFLGEIPPDIAAICEDDGIVAVRTEGRQAPGWRHIKRLGRGGGDLVEAYEQGSPLYYPILLTEDAADSLLEIHRYPSLNSTGRIRVEVSVDEGTPQMVESESNDEWRGQWTVNTMDHVDKLYLHLPAMKRGVHTVTFTAVDRYFAFTKFVLYCRPRKYNSLGTTEGSQALPDEKFVKEASDIWYGTLPLKPRPMIYADRIFAGNTLLANDLIAEQEEYGTARSPYELLQGGISVYPEKDGQIRIDAVAAYAQTPYAYTEHYTWQYCSSESYGRSGLAMYIRRQGLKWDCAETAPSLNYRLSCDGGDYTVWMLAKFNSNEDSCISAAIDHAVLPEEALCRGGRLWRYEAEQVWRWIPAAVCHMDAGEHLLTVYCLASGLRIDRICLTKGESIPPLDKDWRLR